MKNLLFLLIIGFISTTSFGQVGKMGKSVEQKVKKLSAALDKAGHPLQGNQKADLMTSFNTTMAKMKLAKDDTSDRSAVDRVRRESAAEVKSILTPAQFLTFQDMQPANKTNDGGLKAGGAGSLGSKKDKAEDDAIAEKQDKVDRRAKTEETSRELSEAEVEDMEERKRKAQERRDKMEEERIAEQEKAIDMQIKEEEKEMKDKMKEAKANDKKWAKENEKMSKKNAKQKSMAAVDNITASLTTAGMPLSSTQLKQVKTTMMQEQKKLAKLIEDSGENSADYLKQAKKLRKSSVKKMKSYLSKEQFKFLKKAQY